jgi:hypothetical protein
MRAALIVSAIEEMMPRFRRMLKVEDFVKRPAKSSTRREA